MFVAVGNMHVYISRAESDQGEFKKAKESLLKALDIKVPKYAISDEAWCGCT